MLVALLVLVAGCGDEETSKATDAQSSDATLCGDGGDAVSCGDGYNNNADGSTSGDGQDGVDGASKPCDDQNSCTVDVLNADGSCSHSQRGDGEACDDGNKCSTGDLCISAMCVGSGSAYCGDGNDCTTDACDPLQTGDGCKHVNNLLPCDDGDACTTGDKCTSGACMPGSSKKDCSDGDACTTDSCDSTSGCKHETKKCGDNNPCTTDSCNSTSGLCEYLNNGASCEDGDMCKSGDKCSGGTCISGTVPKDCDDSNACTVDSCVAETGCKHAVQAGMACNDGDPTTKTDVCGADGVCAGIKPLTPCDDNNACTDDAGDPTSGVPCTYKAVSCDDLNGCTKDSCDKASGCVHTDTTGFCDDGDACTVGDKCAAGVCVGGVAPVCNDNNACTNDACDPTSGCVYSPMAGVACNDMDSCTTGDQCDSAGSCKGGPGPNCNDGNSCTADTCDKANGCINLPTSGTVCSGNGICFVGSCKVSNPACADSDACTFDSGTPPANCTHVKIVCDDKNPCTDDSCDPTSGLCKFNNNAAACDDGNACTVSDVCSAGTCASGTGMKCDDGDSCTTDACDKTGTCAHTTIVGCGFGEICGDGVDNDGDSKIDCADSECGPSDIAHRLQMYAQYGGNGWLVTANAPNQPVQIALPPDGPGGVQMPQYVEVWCSELPYVVKMESSSQLVGLLKAYVVGADKTPATAPLSWYFDVVTDAPSKPTLGAVPSVKKVNSYAQPKGKAFQVSWPPSK